MCVYLCVYHIFFIHSSTNIHLGCVHILAMVNNTVMNIKDYLQDSDFISFPYMPRRQIADSYDRSMFNYFWRISRLFSIVVISIYTPTKSAAGFLYFPPLCQHLISLVFAFFVLFCSNKSDISHCSFDLHFSDD